MTGGIFVVEADGGSRGNPGPAGFGALVRDATSGAVLAERGEAIGTATNNVAEYRGLIAGLEAAIGLGAETVHVRMDSKLVVEQMSGRWKVKHPDMKPLALQAQRLARQIPRIDYTWIPRADNSAADRLANQAMDGTAIGAAQPITPRTRSSTRSTEPSAPAPGAIAVAELPPLPAEFAEPTRTYLLRHGVTEHTVAKVFSGRNDLALTEDGVAQADRAAQHLAGLGTVGVVVSSPLLRTEQTAQRVAAALHLDVEIDEDLAELDFGSFEGLSYAQLRESHPDELRAFLGSAGSPAPGGESLVAVQVRVERARRRIIAAHPGRTVLLVSHVTPIKILVATALDVPLSTVYRMYLAPASLSTLDWYADGRASMQTFNLTP